MAPGQTSWDVSPAGAAGRASLAMVQMAGIGWMAFFSLYLWTGQDLKHVGNAAILDVVADWVAKLRLPWLVAADWQNEPRHLESSPWNQELHGHVFFPVGPCGTCRTGHGTERTIDYFWGDQRLAGLLDTPLIQTQAPYTPHKP
eukprot:6310607-Karenia_brevis.AAC.1